MSDWKAKIVDDGLMACAKLYIYRFEEHKVLILMPNGTVKTLNEGEPNPDECATTLPYGTQEAVLEALLRKGVKPQEQSRVEGVLEATKEHLADMRRLVFKVVK